MKETYISFQNINAIDDNNSAQGTQQNLKSIYHPHENSQSAMVSNLLPYPTTNKPPAPTHLPQRQSSWIFFTGPHMYKPVRPPNPSLFFLRESHKLKMTLRGNVQRIVTDANSETRKLIQNFPSKEDPSRKRKPKRYSPPFFLINEF